MNSRGRPSSRRAFTTSRILDAAHHRLGRGGPDELTIRGIASDLEMSPAALYRYFDGRDAILTALITRAYQRLGLDLAAAAEPFADRGPISPTTDRTEVVERLLAPPRAYRAWAIDNRHEFELVFGAPIEGYEAPADGPTIAAMESVQVAFFRPTYDAITAGRIVVSDDFVGDDEGYERLRSAFDAAAPEHVPAGLGGWAMGWWATTHGLVALEINGQFRWLYGDDAGPQFDRLLAAQLGAVLV